MIDINELRKAINRHGASIICDDELIELLDRLEAAEAEALEQARLNGMGSEREAALMAKLEAAEKERDRYKLAYNDWIAKTEWLQHEVARSSLPAKYLGMHRADAIKLEIDRLRAKIEAIEKQEPVGYMPLATKAALEAGGTGVVWNCRDRGIADEPIYALPGAKGEEK